MVMTAARLSVRARLKGEIAQLNELLANYDGETFRPRQRELIRLAQKAAGLQRLIDRRRAEARRAKDEKEQAVNDEAALRLWRRGGR